MVARLKLKGIDGRAPPGVNVNSLAAVALLRTAARKGEVVSQKKNLNASPTSMWATPSNCGELLKLQIPSLIMRKRGVARLIASGTVKI